MRLYATALLLGIMILPAHLPLRAANCTDPVAALSTAAWRTITPPKEDVEVVYTSSYGWVGLNRIYATSQALKHKRRSLIPWMMPQIVTVFPFSHALEAPANRIPLFYVDHLDTAAHIGDLGHHEIHLVHLRTRGKDRDFEATSGVSVFNFQPGISSHLEIPLKVNTLSNTVFTIQPEMQLADGEYMIVFGPVAASGFEFEINCLREGGPSMPQINVESRKENLDPAQR
jgi:hypothetical protein